MVTAEICYKNFYAITTVNESQNQFRAYLTSFPAREWKNFRSAQFSLLYSTWINMLAIPMKACSLRRSA